MSQNSRAILVVDDEPFNLEILAEHLTDAGYEVVTAEDGMEAWELLQERQDFDAILLDRMMPRMNGMELLARLKGDSRTLYIPVILQTAVGSADAVQEGLQSGAYYYLTKPFERALLLAIVAAAVNESKTRQDVMRSLQGQRHAVQLIDSANFVFASLEEAKELTSLLSAAFPDPERVALGLSELLINAVEHGNLAITYQEKTRLVQSGNWEAEVLSRLQMPEYRERRVRVSLDRLPDTIKVVVKDEGGGFDWRPFLEFSPERAFDPHGRGISMAKLMSFDDLEYQGAGNQVQVIVRR